MRRLNCIIGAVAVVALGLGIGGCASGSNSILPNPYKDLQKHTKEFAADAAKRVYPADVPHAATSPIRGEVDYQLKVINIVNLSDQPWNNVEVWVNGQYVCALSSLPPKRQIGINFGALFDKEGHKAPSQGVWVEKAEVFYDGMLFDITLHPAD